MPSLAGLYAVTLTMWLMQTPEACREWVGIHCPEKRAFALTQPVGAGVVEGQILQFLRETGRRGLLRDARRIVPPGSSDDPYAYVPLGLMLVRRSKRQKMYIPPNESNFDQNGKALVEQHFGLKVSDWKVVWFDNDDPALLSEFLEPEQEQEQK
ncbi:hypothetical protein FRC10_006488 [Ceratobasidium sp. 414]|nr:hypothetical protein FRC10_006488 [Ceratobasidium sp. 414]